MTNIQNLGNFDKARIFTRGKNDKHTKFRKFW